MVQKVETIKNLISKDVICIELQAGPWPAKPFMEAALGDISIDFDFHLFLTKSGRRTYAGILGA